MLHKADLCVGTSSMYCAIAMQMACYNECTCIMYRGM